MEFYQFISQDQKVQIKGQTFHNAVCTSDGYPQWSSIENCTFTGSCHFTFDSGEITFITCDFTQCTSVIFEFRNSGKVKFGDCRIGTDLQIFKADSVIIIDSSVNGGIIFSKEQYKIVEIVNDKTLRQINKIEFWNSSEDPKSKIRLNNLQVGELKFHEKYPATLHIFGGNYGNIEMNYAHGLNDLIIVGDEMKKTKIKIAILSMTFYDFNGLARIKDASIGTWNLSQFLLKEGSFKVFNVDFSNEVQMIGSEIKGIQFNELDFSKSKMRFDWCVFEGARFTNVFWPQYINFQSIIEDKVQRLGSLTEVFRQLKKVHLADSNNIQALNFYRHEMATYWERVKIDKSETRWNMFLIRVDKWVSDFGQSYTRPFTILLAFTLLCFSAIWLFEYCKHGNSGVWSTTIGNGVVEYLGGLNPIGKVPDYWHNGAKIIIYIMKVVNGFFIYHFIKATRKFGKL